MINFAKKQKFVTFGISFVIDNSKIMQVVFYALDMHDRPNMVLWVNQGLCHFCLVTNTTKISQKLSLETKNQFFGLWKNIYHKILIYWKMLIIEFSFNFLSYRILWSCMIKRFGQPGILFKKTHTKNQKGGMVIKIQL